MRQGLGSPAESEGWGVRVMHKERAPVGTAGADQGLLEGAPKFTLLQRPPCSVHTFFLKCLVWGCQGLCPQVTAVG